MSSLFQGFLHPALAWGAALAAVPLLIHLLNRQHHRPLQWAAMRFVLAAYRRTRRRVFLENLLLLLLRMAAVALLALAIARPFTGADSPLAALTEEHHELVLLVDDSASTGYGDGVESVHDRIVKRAREVLARFRDDRGDRVRLYAVGARPRLLSPRSPEEAAAMLTAWTHPRDEPLDLAAALSEVASFAEGQGAVASPGEGSVGATSTGLEVRLLTDLQRGSFEPRVSSDDAARSAKAGQGDTGDTGDTGATGDLTAALDRLEALGLHVIVEDLGPPQEIPPNLDVEAISPLGVSAGGNASGPLFALPPGLPTDLSIRVANHGAKHRGGVRVTLFVDGKRQRTQPIELEPRASAEAVFSVVFTTPGSHVVEARLEGDGLTVDDRRSAVLRVPGPMDVLLVDGDPHPRIDRDEVGVLEAILSPLGAGGAGGAGDAGLTGGAGRGSVFRPRVVDASLLATDENLVRDADVIVLANVSSLSQRVFDAIERRVSAGACLFVTLGDRSADPNGLESWNVRGWRADGSGLLPARLLRARMTTDRRDAYFRCASFEEDHPALRFFADERWRPLLTEVPIFGFVETEPIEGARVLARLDDARMSPLLLERPFDRGRVLLWTSSIDNAWCRVADSPGTLIPLVHELFRYGTRGRLPHLNLTVGEPITLEASSFPRAPTLVAPDGTSAPVASEAEEVAEGLWRLPVTDSAAEKGLWRIRWEGVDVPVAVGLDPAESDLARIGPRELEAAHPVWTLSDAGEEGDGESERDSARGELWRTLAAATLLALVGETLVAAWIGRGRRSA